MSLLNQQQRVKTNIQYSDSRGSLSDTFTQPSK